MIFKADAWRAGLNWAEPWLDRCGAQLPRLGRGAALLRRSSWLSERWAFFHAWRLDPRGIGAVLPSGRRLASAMTREVRVDQAPVLELGAGTGAFTRSLLARGVSGDDLVLIERDAGLAARLRQNFPGAEVLDIDAAHLDRYVLFSGRLAGVAICGLPLLNMPLRSRLRILLSVFTQLRTDGACYLFTYGLRCPVPPRLLERMGLRARRHRQVWINVPPAHVWKLTRRAAPCARSSKA